MTDREQQIASLAFRLGFLVTSRHYNAEDRFDEDAPRSIEANWRSGFNSLNVGLEDLSFRESFARLEREAIQWMADKGGIDAEPAHNFPYSLDDIREMMEESEDIAFGRNTAGPRAIGGRSHD